MAKMNFCILLCILIALKLISCAEVRRNFDQSGNRKRSVSDPVSNFFSELGDLFLDIDGTIAVQTAPKVQREDRLASRIFEPLQPSREYFNRVQENYRTLQDRLGSLIADTISASGAIRRANRLNEALLPDNYEEIQSVQRDDSNARHEIKSSDTSRKQVADAEEQMRRSMERLVSNTRKTNQFIGTIGSQALDAVSSVLTRRSGDRPETPYNSDPQGRIIGDDLYSESRFDQYIRQLLKNHGRWVLDNPLLQRWRGTAKNPRTNLEVEVPVEEQLSEEPEEMVSTSTVVTTIDSGSTETFDSSTKSLNELPLLEENLPEKLSKMARISGSYYRIGDSGDVIEEEVDIVLEPESGRIIGVEETEALKTGDDKETVIEIEEMDEERDTVILAFTPDGVPLKLKMGPEIENPVKYLHRVLRLAGVSLKVPVESYEDLEPVGKEVLLLGAGSGIINRAVYIDVSNPNELKSLLRTLVKSKVSENY